MPDVLITRRSIKQSKNNGTVYPLGTSFRAFASKKFDPRLRKKDSNSRRKNEKIEIKITRKWPRPNNDGPHSRMPRRKRSVLLTMLPSKRNEPRNRPANNCYERVNVRTNKLA